MSKNPKIERTQKLFLKALKTKFSNESEPELPTRCHCTLISEQNIPSHDSPILSFIGCPDRGEFSKDDIEILGSITPNIRNEQWKAQCNLHTKVNWPYIFCEQIREKGLCPRGFK